MFILFSTMCILTACVSVASTEENPLNYPDNETITVLFSDSSSLQDEHTYYDAYLALQQHYDEEIPSIIIVDADDRDAIRFFEINQFPTMLILTGKTEHVRLEGVLTEEAILAELLHFFLAKETNN